MRRLRVYLLCGIVGSGKSTWAKRLIDHLDNAVIVNKDAIRIGLFGGTYRFDAEVEPIVRSTAKYLVLKALRHGFDVVIDECNLTQDRRLAYFELVKSIAGVDVELVVFTEKTRNLSYRASDPRGLFLSKWVEVIEGMRLSWEEPLADEIEEHYLNVRRVRNPNEEIEL